MFGFFLIAGTLFFEYYNLTFLEPVEYLKLLLITISLLAVDIPEEF